MAIRTDIKTILVVGSGPIVIGQGCEFDYSGNQALRNLRALGFKTILVNSNAATIMNDIDLSDRTYIEPLTKEFLEKIIIKERPDAILPTVGGQTALNLCMQLAEDGILAKYNVEMIGASVEAIKKAEDRALFDVAMKKIGLETPKNVIVRTLEEAMHAVRDTNNPNNIGLPCIIRPSFTLGGTGGGIAYNINEFQRMILEGLNASPIKSVQIDQSIIGFKEYELEVVCDSRGNFLVICAIENIDPMGVHTGDSITVAPSVTLTDKEYQVMRNSAKKILSEIGIQTGGANVQFAVNPENGQQFVIEMNPRVSRSSALASKATGYPIAAVASAVAVGQELDEIDNACAIGIPASFEPSIDYIVVKIPRFNFEKFPIYNNMRELICHELSTSMKAIGEVMALGSNFCEALQKAVISLEVSIDGVYSQKYKTNDFASLAGRKSEILIEISRPISDRILKIADAFRAGASKDEVHSLCKYDMWFLDRIYEIVDVETGLISTHGESLNITKEELFELKKLGFSDARIAYLINKEESEVTDLRHKYDLYPVFKRVDTCAAEFDVRTNYLYSTYKGDIYNNKFVCESAQSDEGKDDRPSVIILGSGPNRIGQGIEFDYSCVHAAEEIKAMGMRAIMINCNPETVSTDYQTSDKLYFEPLNPEHVLEVIRAQQRSGKLLGVISQFGGQTALKLVQSLRQYDDIKILGTSPDSLDIAEDRKRFKDLLDGLNLKQPKSITCHNAAELYATRDGLNFPLMLRPSYVLGGRGMGIVYDDKDLKQYLRENYGIFDFGPLLVDEFLTDATEIDVDALSDGSEVYIAGIMEHIEEAGIHSGDSTCATPPPYLSKDILEKVSQITVTLTRALNVIGVINIQFAIKDNEVYIIEANPRASRTIPFISKFKLIPFARIATRLACGVKLSDLDSQVLQELETKRFAVKMPVFPFLKFKDTDCNLGPEMKSTGESMGIDTLFEAAFAKAFIGAHGKIPTTGAVLISVRDADKNDTLKDICQILIRNNFLIYATKGTAKYLSSCGIKAIMTHKLKESRPNIIDLLLNNEVVLYINTSDNSNAIREGLELRRAAMMQNIPCVRTISHAKSLVHSIDYVNSNGLSVRALQEYAHGLEK